MRRRAARRPISRPAGQRRQTAAPPACLLDPNNRVSDPLKFPAGPAPYFALQAVEPADAVASTAPHQAGTVTVAAGWAANSTHALVGTRP